MPQCFPLLVIGYPFIYRDFPFFDKICSKSSAAELSYEGKGLPFPTYTKSVADDIENININIRNISINASVISEIAHHEQFLLLPQCFQKLSDAGISERIYMYMWEMVNVFKSSGAGAIK